MATGEGSALKRRQPAFAGARLWLIVVIALLTGAGHASPPPPFVIGSLPQDARITIYSE